MSIFDGLTSANGTVIEIHFETEELRQHFGLGYSHEGIQNILRDILSRPITIEYDTGPETFAHFVFNTEGNYTILHGHEYTIWAKKPREERNWGHIRNNPVSGPTEAQFQKFIHNPIARKVSEAEANLENCKCCLMTSCFGRSESFDEALLNQKIRMDGGL